VSTSILNLNHRKHEEELQRRNGPEPQFFRSIHINSDGSIDVSRHAGALSR
jgi:hypothetical protein